MCISRSLLVAAWFVIAAPLAAQDSAATFTRQELFAAQQSVSAFLLDQISRGVVTSRDSSFRICVLFKDQNVRVLVDSATRRQLSTPTRKVESNTHCSPDGKPFEGAICEESTRDLGDGRRETVFAMIVTSIPPRSLVVQNVTSLTANSVAVQVSVGHNGTAAIHRCTAQQVGGQWSATCTGN